MNIKISNGNSKMGAIPSISLPAGLTCRRDCGCSQKCYAKRLERFRPTVHNTYMHNYDLLENDSDTYWREVEASIMMSRFFRFHVSGDIPNNIYFAQMIDIAERNKHCKLICFTKKYNIVNEFIDFGGTIPHNLHIIFSGWHDIEMVNPHDLPEAHVKYRDGNTTAHTGAKLCGGNCAECAIIGKGCWSLNNGEQVVFNEH